MTMETKVNMIIVILGFWPVAIAQLAQTTATVDLVNALPSIRLWIELTSLYLIVLA